MTRSEPGAAAPGAAAPGVAEPRATAIDFALFANGAPFARRVLEALLRRGYPPRRIVLPFYPPASRPDARVDLLADPGRDRFPNLAEDCPVDYAPAAEQDEFAARFAARRIDFILVACWPYLIGAALIGAARKAALNLHPSLLPAFRGADPLGEQLAAGNNEFGVTLHLLDARLDHGDIVAQARIDAGDPADRATLERSCAECGAELFATAAATHAEGWSLRRQNA